MKSLNGEHAQPTTLCKSEPPPKVTQLLLLAEFHMLQGTFPERSGWVPIPFRTLAPTFVEFLRIVSKKRHNLMPQIVHCFVGNRCYVRIVVSMHDV